MNRLWQSLRHAFAVPSSATCAPTPAQMAAIDAVCRYVVAKRMTLPAQMVLDTSAPLGPLAGQAIPFFQPWLRLVLSEEQIRDWGAFLERRGAMEYLSQRLQHFEDLAAAAGPRKPHAAE